MSADLLRSLSLHGEMCKATAVLEIVLANFIHVTKAGYTQEKVLVDADFQTILNTDFIEMIEPLELSKSDPGRYVRVRYKGEALIVKGSVTALMEKVH